MVFFSSCNSVQYHCELLNYIDVPVAAIHGKQKQKKRTTTFFEFCNAKTGVLLCTDVAARGLDIPAVDWIVQYDPPDDPKEYIHRVGRTARGASSTGRALLLLTPQEVGFLQYLRDAKVTMDEYEFPDRKLVRVQAQLEALVAKNYYLNQSARNAFRSYLLAYASHSHKHIFNVHEVDLAAVGKSFGFAVPPKVPLNFSHRGGKGRAANRRGRQQSRVVTKALRKHKHRAGGGGSDTVRDEQAFKQNRGGGRAFSASNPYGRRDKNDKRQFQK